MIDVEVGFANVEQQVLIAVSVEQGATVQLAIDSSGVLNRFPEINLEINKVGIFSKVCKLQHTLQSGDRIEIYRPLLIDPKESRRQRAGKGKSVAIDSAD